MNLTNMFQSIRLSSTKAGRTIVRDPRKKKIAVSSSSSVQLREENKEVTGNVQYPKQSSHIPFAPSNQNQESVGSTLASYALAGVGMTMGFALVRILFGV